MELYNFWLTLDALCNKAEAHPDIKVRLCTLEGEYDVGVIELLTDSEGNSYIQLNSDEICY